MFIMTATNSDNTGRNGCSQGRLIALIAIAAVLIVGAFVLGFGSGYVVRGTVASRPGVLELPRSSHGETDGAGPAIPPSPTPHPEEPLEFTVFWEAWGLVERHFYGELPDAQSLTYGAIRGMLETLDDNYTAFMEPEIASITAEDATGEFQGIGAYVDLDETGTLIIVEPFAGSPAEAAGLEAGDRVLAVDGTDITGRSLYECISLIRGPSGSTVTLLVEREGKETPFEVDVERARIEIPITDVEMREDGVGYLRLNEFSSTAREHVADGLEELLKEDPVGIVLDLRSNPGGWLDQSLEVADLFLDDGTIAIERFSDGTEEVYEARSGHLGEDVPLVVLVDRASASASEIVAGALQDHERAILVGETTFGKGSVQRPFELSDGSELRVTIARWYTPNERAIHGSGLEPDIAVPYPDEDEQEATEEPADIQLERAVEYLLEGE